LTRAGTIAFNPRDISKDNPMPASLKVLALGGDYIGPEVVASGLRVLDHAARRHGMRVDIEEDLLGGAAWDRYGTFCRDETVAKAREADAVLVGAVGGPKWDSIYIDGPPQDKDGLTRLRMELEVYNAMRPARAWKQLLDKTPYRRDVIEGADIMVVRENCGGIYFGHPRGIEKRPDGSERGFEMSAYTTGEVERVARAALELARRRRQRLVSVDKSNVMESGVLWRRVVSAVAAREYPDVELRHLYTDNALFQLTRAPRNFDVVLADNLFGDLISDLLGAIAGSLGMLPSATLAGLAPKGERTRPGVYEPTHGTAPDIAGQGIANPIGTILSVAMIFEYGFARPDIALAIESAVSRTLDDGILTPDIGGAHRTEDITQAVLKHLGKT
jgi:3-isopropylmalate dehydrogenase